MKVNFIILKFFQLIIFLFAFFNKFETNIKVKDILLLTFIISELKSKKKNMNSYAILAIPIIYTKKNNLWKYVSST